MDGRIWLVLGGVVGGTGVALGAFGAHAWNPMLTEAGQLEVFHTAGHYQMYHAAALVLVGLLAARQPSGWLSAAGGMFLGGVLLFSGSLYALALLRASGVEGASKLGMVAPLGGTLLILGWFALALGGWRVTRH